MAFCISFFELWLLMGFFYVIMLHMQENRLMPFFKGMSLPVHPLYIGREKCEPLHKFGRNRDHHIIHYVHSGRGKFTTRDNTGRSEWITHPLKRGQAFVISPRQEHWYQADSRDPWEYWWIAFQVSSRDAFAKLLGLSSLPDVVTLGAPERFEQLFERAWVDFYERRNLSPALMLSETLELLDSLFAESQRTIPEEKDLWGRYEDMVNAGFGDPITVDEIARSLGMSRSSLHRLVKKRIGISPKEHLTRCRMEAAKVLLQDLRRPVYQVASLVGYREYQSFERQFKLHEGVPPGGYRERSGKTNQEW